MYHLVKSGGVGGAAKTVWGGVVQQFTDTSSPRAFGHTTTNWLALLPGPESAGAGFASEASTEARAVSKFCQSGGQCLVAGTLVWMADGTTEPVERVKAGDWVLSRDPATGKVSASRVGQCTERQAGSVEAVTLADAATGQSQTLVCSPEHPFYVDSRGFVAAASLGVGTQIVTRAGPTLTVTAVEERHDAKGGYAVFNFVVPGDHTYFVGTLQGGAWVHNPKNCGQLELDLGLPKQTRRIHGNSLDNPNPGHVYQIWNDTKGILHKYGESADIPLVSGGKSVRAETQVRELNAPGNDQYSSRILRQVKNKAAAREWERMYIQRFVKRKGYRPEGNQPGNGDR